MVDELTEIKYSNGATSGLRQFLATESPFKMMKMLFISPQKLFSLSRYLIFFFLTFWSCSKKG